MSYTELMETLAAEDYSPESSKYTDNKSVEYVEPVIIEDDREGTTVLSKDVQRVLERNSINYIINPDNLDHPKKLENAVDNGVYKPEFDSNRKGGKRIKIIYDDTLNIQKGVDAYVVGDEELAESMESQGLNVARYPAQILEFL